MPITILYDAASMCHRWHKGQSHYSSAWRWKKPPKHKTIEMTKRVFMIERSMKRITAKTHESSVFDKKWNFKKCDVCLQVSDVSKHCDLECISSSPTGDMNNGQNPFQIFNQIGTSS